jgi:acyl carrier protein
VQQLEQEIKALIISAMALEDITPDDIDTEAPLFGAAKTVRRHLV